MFVKANAPADLLKQQLAESVQQWPDCALTGDWPVSERGSELACGASLSHRFRLRRGSVCSVVSNTSPSFFPERKLGFTFACLQEKKRSIFGYVPARNLLQFTALTDIQREV
jgi:hypothetical protein